MEDLGANVKIRLQFDKGTQTLNQCNSEALDQDLFEVAETIADLREHKSVKFIKVTEERLLG